MDIPRSAEVKQQRKRRRIVYGVLGGLIVLGVTLGLTRLKPAAPTVERSTVWTDTVKRGPMLRQVRGIGTLVPIDIRWIPAESEARVEVIHVLPGTPVDANTVIMELSNPQAEQEALDAEWQLRAAEAEYKNARVKLEGDLMNQQASAATVSADYNEAQRRAETDQELAKLGVISGLALKTSAGHAEEMATRHNIEQKRIDINTKAIDSQMAVQTAKVEQLRAMAQLRRKQLDALKVRAGIDGVLQEVPVQVGQHVQPGATLAKVAQPEHLKAELKIPETQAKDVTIGQPATIDTHNGIIPGKVMRVDPAVLNGTVTVDVRLEGELPKGVARPDLSVDGTIDLERLANVLYVGRPAFGQEKNSVGMFRLDADGKTATRVTVQLGRSSVNAIEILGGLKEGDHVVLSDMSRWDNYDRIKLE
jgi:RND family efflux transporter MFP subunit